MTSVTRPFPGLTGRGRRARWRRAVLRRLLAAGLLVTAVVLVMGQLRPPPPATVPVVTAATGVPAGSVLGPGDLALASVPAAGAPPGALTEVSDAVGRRVGSAMAAGEALTRTRLVPRTPAEGLAPGRVALHVTLADPASADVLRPGLPVLVFPSAGGAPLARSAVVLVTDPVPQAGMPGLGAEPATRGVLLSLGAAEAQQVLAGHGGLEGPVVVNVVAAGP